MSHRAVRAPGTPLRGQPTRAHPGAVAGLGFVVALLAALVGAPPARAAVAVVVIEGEGHGHGVGMAQDGAYWMGVDGASTEQILAHFYPGTATGRGEGDVRVVVSTPAAAATVVAFPNGGEVRSPLTGEQAPGFPIRVSPGGSVRVRHDGVYRAEPLAGASASAGSAGAARTDLAGGGPRQQQLPIPTSTTSTTAGSTTSSTARDGDGLPPPMSSSTTTTSTTAPSSTTSTTSASLLPGPTTTAPAPDPGNPPGTAPPPADPGAPTSARPLWAVPADGGTVELPDRARRYRGVVQATVSGGPFRLLNHVDVEQYLRGMGEVRDARWSIASLGAQAVAARTYALRTVLAGGELCDTQRCQVYLGQQVEYRKMDEAVAVTAGRILTFGRGLAVTVYSANGGGISATPEEGFGTSSASFPYLAAAPYTTRSPDPWRVDIGAADLGARLGYPGELTGIAVARTGPSGRPITVTLSGSGGDVEVGALKVQRAAGLRSTLWRARTEQSDQAPPAPPAADMVQALPEQVVAEARTVQGEAARRPSQAIELDVPGVGEDGARAGGAPAWTTTALAAFVTVAGAGGLATLVSIERAPVGTPVGGTSGATPSPPRTEAEGAPPRRKLRIGRRTG